MIEQINQTPMKYILALLPVFLFIACNPKDEAFCKCLSESEKLNDKSQEIFQNGVNENNAKELKALKEKQSKACENYKNMNGPDMLKRKEACKKD